MKLGFRIMSGFLLGTCFLVIQFVARWIIGVR
jgi:hypothetical protein